MKRFCLILLLYPLFSSAIMRHNQENDCMLISLPKSGSSFLASIIEENNLQVKYQSERLTRQWGGTNYCKYGQDILLKGLYNSRFAKTDLNFSKEVYLNLYMSLFRQRFTLFCLYRHRNHTFPSDRVGNFIEIFNSFISIKSPDKDIDKIRKYIKKTAKTDLQKQCAIHTVMNYIMLSDALKYNIPVINYKMIMELEGQELFDYLKERVPFQLFTDSLSELLEKKRFKEKKFFSKKEENYQRLSIEWYYQEVITFIKNINPNMAYWNFFD